MQDSKFGEHLYLTPRVPRGLAAAVEGLTREVIRHRPDNIYAFAARHFENLLRLREQYDSTSSSSDDKKDAKPANETVRECRDEEVKEDTAKQQTGWSLNETAKVLEKHRSIFGEAGQKVSTEQIRELANEPLLTARERSRDGSPSRRKVGDPGTSRRRDSPQRDASRARNAPKMLSQIPIAKDIKTELRRNRISSRERKKVVACEYTRETTIVEKKRSSSFEKSSSSTRKSSYELRKSSDTKKRTETTTTTTREDKKFTRGGSMDSVKNYVVQNFVGMTSLDELQSPSYVEKVQEVIDETSSLIKEKVEALKSGVARAAKAKQQQKASSGSEDHSGKEAPPSLSRRNSKSVDKDQDASGASSLPAVRPPSSKSTSRSVSAKSDSDAALTLPPISPESAKSPKVKEELVLPVLSPPRTASVEDADDTTAAVEEIAEDATLSDGRVVEEVLVEEKVVEKEGESVDEKVAEKEGETVEDVVVEKIEESVEDIVVETIEESVEEKIVEKVEESVEEKIVEKKGESVEIKVVEKEGESAREKIVEKDEGNVEETIVEKNGDSVEEKIVPPEEIVVPPADSSDDEAREKIDESKAESVAEEIVPSEEKSVPPKDEEAVPSDEIRDKKEIADDKPTVPDQNTTNEGGVPSIEEIFYENLIETSVDDKQSSSDLIAAEKSSPHLLGVKEPEFPDSLNVTPEPFDTKGQRPDSLENSLAEDNKSAASSGHASPVETLKDKLLEIEEVQRRIEDVLDDTKASKDTVVGKADDEATSANIEDKLIEIQESEKRIEQILDSQATSETMNSDIKNKLQELEEAERRIESIFDNETVKECVDEKDAVTIDVEESATAVASESEDKSKSESERREATSNDNLSVPTSSQRTSARIEESRAVSPHSYILTEGSPYEIPDSVTTVIIPDRTPSPDSETLQVDDGQVLSTSLTSKEPESSVSEVLGEAIAAESIEPTTVDVEYARGIKASHDAIVSREKSLDRIDEATAVDVVDSEDEKVLKVVTSSLEEILEREEVEYVEIVKYTETQKVETVENSLESTARSVESTTTTTNEVKETSVTSSLSVDPALPVVPELNLDSLPDLTISSFNLTDKDTPTSRRDDSLDVAETQEFEKLEERLQRNDQPTAASDIGAPTADINNAVCSGEAEASVVENNLESQRTQSIEAINRRESIDDHAVLDEKKAYHIYVPEASSSKEVSSSSETSTFMSAATKIQAGVRGFLTRRRLQSTQKRSSTLDSVPSIQESFAVETSVPLMPIVETTASGISEAKARKKLRREDAVQRTTLSVENAFAENQLQHTGEFHDCIPLPVFDAQALSLKTVKQRQEEKAKEAATKVEHLLEKILLGHAAANFAAHPKLVDVVLLPADGELQSKYLNFITSVEDVFTDLPETPKGVIIEEITSSLDEANTTEEVRKVEANDGEETTLASVSESEDPLSINIEEVLGLGDEDDSKSNKLNAKLSAVEQLQRSSSGVSRDSPVSDERTRSPVTMMQIAPRSVDEKSSEDNPPT